MAKNSKDDLEDLSPAEAEKAKAEASAKGHNKVTSTDVRNAVLPDAEDSTLPKNSGNPRDTGTQAEKKHHRGANEH